MNTRQKLIVTPEQFAEGYMEVVRTGELPSGSVFMVIEKRPYQLIQELTNGNYLVSRPMLPECAHGPARD